MWFGEEHGWLTYDEAVARGFGGEGERAPGERFVAGPNGAVPAYAERVEQLLREAHRLLVQLRVPHPGALLPDVERWFDRYALHTSQVDHPDVAGSSAYVCPYDCDGCHSEDCPCDRLGCAGWVDPHPVPGDPG